MNIKNLSSVFPIDVNLISIIGRILLNARWEMRDAALSTPVYLINNFDFENEIDPELEQRFELDDDSKSAPCMELMGCYCYEWPILGLSDESKIFICPERIFLIAAKYFNYNYHGLFIKVLLHEYAHAVMGMNVDKSYQKFTWVSESFANVGALDALSLARDNGIIKGVDFQSIYDFCSNQPAAYHLGVILSKSNLIRRRWVDLFDIWNGDMDSKTIFPSIPSYFGHTNPFGKARPNSNQTDEIIRDYELYAALS